MINCRRFHHRITSLVKSFDCKRRSILRCSLCRNFEFLDHLICTIIYDDLYGSKVRITLSIKVKGNEVIALTCHRLACIAEPHVVDMDIQNYGYIPGRDITASFLLLVECELTSCRGEYLGVIIFVIQGQSRTEIDSNLDICQLGCQFYICRLVTSDVNI